MKKRGQLLLAIACALLLPARFFAQNLSITYDSPDALTVCGSDQTSVTLTNSGGPNLANLTLKATLATGLRYRPGSVSGGATEADISNLAAPVFGLGTLAGGATASFTITLEANCDAADALNAGLVFKNTLRAEWSGGSEEVTTNGFPLETGLIIINSVTPQTWSGEAGDMVVRRINFTNTRQGKIGSLIFRDEHNVGLLFEIPGFAGSTPSPVLFEANIPGGFFTAFGNGDAFLDFGETAVIEEKVTIDHCGVPPFSNTSNIEIGWGCGGDVCQRGTAVGETSILTSTKNPALSFFTEYGYPLSYCADAPSEQILTIVNNGLAPAHHILLDLRSEDSTALGMDAGSFTIDGQAIMPNLAMPGALLDCDQNHQKKISLAIPKLEPGDTVRVQFDAFFCADNCGQRTPRIFGNYFYNKNCPPTAFDVGEFAFLPDTNFNRMKARVFFDIGTCLQNGESYALDYWVASPRLTQTDGFLTLQMHVPWGLFWDATCQPPFTLDGQTPLNSSIEEFPGDRTDVKLTFKLPFTRDSLGGKFCLKNICQDAANYPPGISNPPKRGENWTVNPVEPSCSPCVLKLRSETTISTNPDPESGCGVSACDAYQLIMDCGCDDPGFCSGNGLAGIAATFDAFRTNFGHADADDDRNADLPFEEADHAAARWNRFVPGDTMRTRLRGVVTAGGVDKFDYRIFHESLASEFGFDGGDAFLIREGQPDFVNYDSLFLLAGTIVFKTQGNTFTCPLTSYEPRSDQHYVKIAKVNIRPEVIYDELISQFHQINVDISALSATGCVPAGTVLGVGDSVVVEADFKFTYNFLPEAVPDVPLVNFRASATNSDKVYAWNFDNVAITRHQFSGYRQRIVPGAFSIKSCENSVEVQSFLYALAFARPNLFPSEVRPFTGFLNWQHTVPRELDLLDLRLRYLKLQGAADPLFADEPFPYFRIVDTIRFDFSQHFAFPLDEGFAWEISPTFGPACNFRKTDTAWTAVKLAHPDGFYKPNPRNFFKTNLLGYFSNQPRLQLFAAHDILETPGERVELEVFLKNLAAAQAEHAWMRVWTDDGSLTEISVSKNPGGLAVPILNGIFQIGQVGGFYDLPFWVRAKNGACEPVTMHIAYGWDCAPFVSPGGAVCFSDTIHVELRQLAPTLELVLAAEPADIQLCEPSDWFEIEIYNANEGIAYDVSASVKLPQGLEIQAGSAQIAWPKGSAWQSLDNPAVLPGNVFQWPNSALPAPIQTDGLPPVNTPGFDFVIRFRVFAKCGFVANAQPIFHTIGFEGCGKLANELRKPGMPVNLSGLAPTYDVLASLTPAGGNDDPTGCGAEKMLAVRLDLQGSPGAGDSIFVGLPTGVSYVSGSYLPGQNAPAGQPVLTAGGSQLQWFLPPGLAGGSVVKFTFKVKYDTPGDCQDKAIVLQTREKTTALCTATNSNCDVYVATGESILFFGTGNPELTFQNFKPTAGAGGQVNFTADLANIGAAAAQNPVVQIFLDQNGNGLVDIPGDKLVQTVSHAGSIAAGASGAVSGMLDLPSSDLCKLIAYLPAAENCACQPRSVRLSGWSVEHRTLASCVVAPATFGVPNSGGTYAWTPAAGLSCATCSETVFTPGPTVKSGDMVSFVLTETAGGCVVEHVFAIQFAGDLGVETDDQKICRGESATLAATPGGTYSWSGPGLGNVASQNQTVRPSETSTYSVTVTFAAGCTGSDAVTVSVFEGDSIDLGKQKICEGGTFEFYGSQLSTAGFYSKTWPNADGCDSVEFLVLEVLPLKIEEARALCPGDSVFVFDKWVKSEGQFCRDTFNALGCQISHCINVQKTARPVLPTPRPDTVSVGTAITLNGPGGFATYDWLDQNCPNCQDLELTSLDTGRHEFVLYAAPTGGCGDTVTYRVFVFPPCDPARLPIPNIFSPDGNGTNDTFRVADYEGFERVETLEIYDRWGQRIFRGTGPSVAWDGTIDGKPAPNDVYIYILGATCPEAAGKRVGDVTIIR